MAQKKRYEYICQECGYEAFQWLGKCPDCGQWNTFAERMKGASAAREKKGSLSALLPQDETRLQALDAVPLPSAEYTSTGYAEFDRVLGGGVFSGSTVLIAGEPGIGKSTLLLKAGVAVAQAIKGQGKTVLYISAEESAGHLKKRANRLSLTADNFYIVAETDCDRALAYAEKLSPAVIVIDSIQAVSTGDFESPPGTITQVRECAARWCHYARTHESAVMLVGHVTKDGVLAGPKSLEHLVDAVIYFEGDRYDEMRLLRAVKNRHGATGEIGIFEMTEQGLREVANPSEFFLGTDDTTTAGRATVALIEGRRPFLVDVQALVHATQYNNPLRRSLGIEANKVALLCAVIEKSLAIRLSQYDVFIKSAGGIAVHDPAADCAIVMAIAASLKEYVIPSDTLFIGEIGLGGDVRKVKRVAARIAEAERLGFRHAFVPKGTKIDVRTAQIQVAEVATLAELYSLIFQKSARRQKGLKER